MSRISGILSDRKTWCDILFGDILKQNVCVCEYVWEYNFSFVHFWRNFCGVHFLIKLFNGIFKIS